MDALARAQRVRPRPQARQLGPAVTLGAPLRAIQVMVQRATESGLIIGPDVGIGVDDALRCFTVNAAFARHQEDVLGSITPGQACRPGSAVRRSTACRYFEDW